jgi:hypothetical protein
MLFFCKAGKSTSQTNLVVSFSDGSGLCLKVSFIL